VRQIKTAKCLILNMPSSSFLHLRNNTIVVPKEIIVEVISQVRKRTYSIS